MKAIAARRYGPPDSVRLIDLPKPVPKEGEVLVRIRAATVSAADMRLRSGRFPRGFGAMARLIFGLTKLRQPILGTDLAGEVEAVGAGVTAFAPGHAVIAFVGGKGGCHAAYRTVPVSAAICAKPAGLSWEQAAALPFGATTALYFLRDRAKLAPGDRVLIVGASGAVGSAAVQLARHFGAVVTAVTSGPNAALVRKLGAGDVIDYREADWAALGRQWDVILDTTGSVTLARARPCLSVGGRLALAAADLPQMLAGAFARGLSVLTGTAPERADDLRLLAALAGEGVLTPVVSATFPLAEAARAHQIADSGRKIGNVVLVVA
jgi:NADPH:quinone reductase-like Zn-dependent oxidoreductase